jgi:hypothetical protein
MEGVSNYDSQIMPRFKVCQVFFVALPGRRFS